MTVADRTENDEIIRATKTDSKGHFRLPTERWKTVYRLRIEHPLWNPLERGLKLDKRAPQRGITTRPEIDGRLWLILLFDWQRMLLVSRLLTTSKKQGVKSARG